MHAVWAYWAPPLERSKLIGFTFAGKAMQGKPRFWWSQIAYLGTTKLKYSSQFENALKL